MTIRGGRATVCGANKRKLNTHSSKQRQLLYFCIGLIKWIILTNSNTSRIQNKYRIKNNGWFRWLYRISHRAEFHMRNPQRYVSYKLQRYIKGSPFRNRIRETHYTYMCKFHLKFCQQTSLPISDCLKCLMCRLDEVRCQLRNHNGKRHPVK